LLKIGEISHYLLIAIGCEIRSRCRKLGFLRISANWHGICEQSGIRGTKRGTQFNEEKTMTAFDIIANRLTAAVSALALSLVLVTGTMTTPATAYAQTAYVGVVA
jgi:hypothetical protein